MPPVWDNDVVMRAQALVDRDAIRHNLSVVRAAVGERPLMAIVKADAYGHGAVEVARTARGAGVEWLGLALPSEALALRAAGDAGRMLAWLWTPGDPDVAACVAADVDLSVSSAWALAEIVAAARAASQVARVQLKVDTGLSRNGVPPGEWDEVVTAARRAVEAGAIEITGIWSHLANADLPGHASVGEQRTALLAAVEVARGAGVGPGLVHLANSPAALAHPDCALDLVRVGIAMYGVSPLDHGSAARLGLRPAMTLRAAVAHVKQLPAGTSVSYGHAWTADRPTQVALVPVGYADGIPRTAQGAWVRINGQRCPVLGRIAMDQFVVQADATVRPGDEVVVFGTDPTADDWAQAAGTIGYEIVTRIGSRVPRAYVGEP